MLSPKLDWSVGLIDDEVEVDGDDDVELMVMSPTMSLSFRYPAELK